MRDDWVPQTAKRLSNYLFRLREKRRSQVAANRKDRARRSGLTKNQRERILRKTNSRCHICGGKIKGKWQADHVLSYSSGGEHAEDNYLPAHSTCNNYRWHYSPEEFQEIMKLGIWIKTQIINQTSVGTQAADKYVKYEQNRIKRRKV